MHEQVSIGTSDGDCPAHVFTPDGAGEGPWPAVILYMDGLGIRPALFAMGQRLADMGYLVLLPDMFYRNGPYPAADAMEIISSGSFREKLGHLFASTDNLRAAADTGAFLAWLDSRPDKAPGKVGATGYCMGGAMALTAAGTYPEAFGAAASFHGGNLVNDTPQSPHLRVPAITARVYVAGADADASYPPEMAEKLEAILTEAGVDHRCEIYEGALHGWTMTDFPIYDEPAAERHWRELEKLFGETLGTG